MANTSRRDCVVMALVSVLTICLIVLPTEWISRRMFPRTKTTALDCLVVNDATTGVRGIPNCVSSEKIYEESHPTEYKLNSRGHRAGMELRPKPPGTFRIVMVGSSIAEGVRVAQEQTFAALLPKELSRKTGRTVQIYNEGLIYGTPRRVDLAFKEALDAQPDMILWIVTPYDLEYVDLADAPWARPQAGGAKGAALPVGRETLPDEWQLAVSTLDRARGILMLRHFLYKSQTQYVRSYLMQDEEGGFLKVKLSAAAKTHLQHFDRYATDIEAQASRAGVPLVATVVPHGAQATMISMREWPAGYDPFKLGNEVRSIIERHGGTYIDVLHGFRSIPNPERYFLAVDGHPTAAGHKILCALLANALTSGAVPALRACNNNLESAARGISY